MATNLNIQLQPGNVAPRYGPETTQLTCKNVVITERGMESGLPLIDFQCEDAEGRKFFFALSGRLVSSIAGAIMGVNVRNHGNPDP